MKSFTNNSKTNNTKNLNFNMANAHTWTTEERL